MSVRAPVDMGTAPLATGEWLTPLRGHWLDAACAQLAQRTAVVRVTVVALRGSAPREPGASLLVHAHGTLGTIGGGQLEWRATAAARELLADAAAPPVRIADLVLGPDLGQCCGGRVELWLERLTRDDLEWLDEVRRLRRRDEFGSGHPRRRVRERGWHLATEVTNGGVSHRWLRGVPGSAAVELKRATRDGDSEQTLTLLEALTPRRPPLWIFGAGHVGQALVRLLVELGLFDITWVDSRGELLPGELSKTLTLRPCTTPADLVADAPAGTRFVVMTHDHALDYDLCRRVLLRGDAAWLGLIGSASKAARFRSRLRQGGMDHESPGLTCPVGIPGISSKLPAAIAIAIAAQLLQRDAAAEASPAARGTTAGAADDAAAHAHAHAHTHACMSGRVAHGACAACGAERVKLT